MGKDSMDCIDDTSDFESDWAMLDATLPERYINMGLNLHVHLITWKNSAYCARFYSIETEIDTLD